MRNLRLKLSFDGSRYHGWQIQENAKTVQGEIERAIIKVFGKHLTVYGCSRTDAGVHANEYYCNFRTEKGLDCNTVVRALNAYLPFDISISECTEMPLEFHSQHDCISKEYVYKILNSDIRNPFMVSTVLQYRGHIDDCLLDNAAKQFIGTFDYKAFCSAGSSVTDTVRTVMNAGVKRDGDMVYFTVEANGFLYNMVRIMTGTLLNINERKIDSGSIGNIILSKDRSAAGFTAPAMGLYLNNVLYKVGDAV